MDAVGAGHRASWRAPSVGMAMLLYAGYLAIFFATWAINGCEYTRIGANAETTRLWYAYPTLFGSAFLVIAISVLGWWRLVLFDASTAGPRWIWILPAAMAAIILSKFLALPWSKVSPELLLWSSLGALGVGFGEEMITRGSMVVGLRSRFGEFQVWLIGTALFAALHVPNVLFGLPLWGMPIQVLLTFVMGTGFYLMRRMSGTLILPMALHGLWDSALFVSVAAGNDATPLQAVVYPLAIACAIGVALHARKAKRASTNPAEHRTG